MARKSAKSATFAPPPTTLDEALTFIEALRKAGEAAAEEADKRIAKLKNHVERLEGALSDKEDELETAVEAAEYAVQEHAHDLACVRQKIKAGRIDDAIYDLDKILSDVDPGCKARTTAVAVML